MLQFRSRSSGLTAVIVLFVWCGTWTWIIGSDVCILPYFILFFLFITYMSVVCLLSSHANCDILYVYLYAVSVYLCLLACCVFIGLAAWNKMDDDSGHFGPPLPFWAPAPPALPGLPMAGYATGSAADERCLPTFVAALIVRASVRLSVHPTAVVRRTCEQLGRQPDAVLGH